MTHPTTLAMTLLALPVLSVGAAAQSTAPGSAPVVRVPLDDPMAESNATDLAKKLQNPIGDLYSFPFQNNSLLSP